MTEQNKELDDQIREIKRRLRAAMNGVLSGSMRQSGIDYRVNFGVDQPRLAEIAAEIPHIYTLAATLWKDNIREMRLLAAMTMPQEDFDEELAMLWVEQLRYAEEAQVLVLHLLQHRPYASSMAFRLVAADTVMPRLVGWLLLRCRRTSRPRLHGTLCPRWRPRHETRCAQYALQIYGSGRSGSRPWRTLAETIRTVKCCLLAYI